MKEEFYSSTRKEWKATPMELIVCFIHCLMNAT